MIDFDTRLTLARGLAARGGGLAREMRQNRGDGFVRNKAARDFVTEADLAVETLLRNEIADQFPEDGFLGEEGGKSADGQVTWIIDPIDGTTNYLRGFPEWGVSIAIVCNNQIEAGVIALPDLSRLIWARNGQGCWSNGEQTQLTSQKDNNSRLASLGYSSRSPLPDHFDLLSALQDQGFDFRRSGAACFDLTSVALGWSDLFYESVLNCWDCLAGALIIREAGGQVFHPELPGFFEKAGPVYAGSPAVLKTEIGTVLRWNADTQVG